MPLRPKTSPVLVVLAPGLRLRTRQPTPADRPDAKDDE
jgi:hypothetical protein